MNLNHLPPMGCDGTFEGRCSNGPDAPQLVEIRPTDIMLGRGPAFYNNPGNRMLRKLVKEHVVHYKNEARRRDKAALVKLIVSKLQAMGYRFLHRCSSGTWVEAPAKAVEKKVGHGLRDARLAADKNGGELNVLWKNFRPAITEQKSSDQVKPVSNEEVKTTEEQRSEKPDTTPVMTMSVEPPMVVSAAKLPHEGLEPLVSSNSVFDILQESENSGFSPFDREIEEVFQHWDSGGYVKSAMEPWQARPVSFCVSEIDDRLQDSEHGVIRRSVSQSDGATNESHVVDAVGLALNMYAGLFYEDSVHDFPVDEPSQSLGYPVHDGQSLCRWFGSLP